MRVDKRIIVLLVLLTLIWGCGKAPERKSVTPIPGAPTKEPTISLFIKEQGVKKDIKLEEYLAGVVAAEMDPTWPESALAAQAIVARTFTMENIQTGRVRELHGTDASTDVEEFQAYNPDRINDRVRKAVASTRGEVITNRGNYIKAWFSACDGGIAASAQEGLAYFKKPTNYIQAGVRDDCLTITEPENKHWLARIPLTQVRAAVRKISGADPGSITQVTIAERGPSGRATKFRIGSGVVSGPQLRLALGSEKVRSTLISRTAIEGGNLILEGKGFGHGVGLCQWGANKMARAGKSATDIIRFYYRDVDIQKLWA